MVRKVENKLNGKQSEKLKILMVTAETRPFAQVGGQGAAVAHLAKALRILGHDARIFMPKFGFINENVYPTKYVYKGLGVPTGHKADYKRRLLCNVKLYNEYEQTPVYFLENLEYYEKRANVYNYSDDHVRWALLGRGVLEYLSKSGLKNKDAWIPNIIHSHDWHTALTSNFLKMGFKDDPAFANISAVYTIHNLMFQGLSVSKRDSSELKFDDGKSAVAPFFSERLKYQNFMKRGILYSDVVNTVSPTYSKEIMTEEYGEGLDRLLSEVRSKVSGILNGIDYTEFNPKTDKLIKANYDYTSFSKRHINKKALQKEFGLPIRDDVPLIGFVGRLDSQKGIDLILSVLWVLLKDFDVQFVQVGGGADNYSSKFAELKEAFSKKVGIHTYANFTLPRLVFSGSDMMLFPSKFEPCGLAQVEAMRYGSIPIVRAVGGLADTVDDFDPETGEGTGFVFKDYNKYPFFAQIIRALETYRYRNVWRKLIKNAMTKDFSWEKSAEDYVSLYKKADVFRGEGNSTVV